MIPIADEIRSQRTPFVNYALLAANILVFAITGLSGLVDFHAFTQSYGLIPLYVTRGFYLEALPTFFTSMFMHGSLLHLGGNMLYLWIFGDNVEDAMGHVGYLFFYLLGGLVASTAHILVNPYSTVPTVGASGAIAAVLGAYALLYPGSRVRTIIPLGFYLRVAVLPAGVVLGFWFALELLQGLTAVGMDPNVGGVAFWAHIGGFVMGVVLARVFGHERGRYGGPGWGG